MKKSRDVFFFETVDLDCIDNQEEMEWDSLTQIPFFKFLVILEMIGQTAIVVYLAWFLISEKNGCLTQKYFAVQFLSRPKRKIQKLFSKN